MHLDVVNQIAEVQLGFVGSGGVISIINRNMMMSTICPLVSEVFSWGLLDGRFEPLEVPVITEEFDIDIPDIVAISVLDNLLSQSSSFPERREIDTIF